MATYPIPVYGRNANFATSPVDGVGTIMLALEQPGWPGVLATSTVYEGPIHVDALQEAIVEAAANRPSLTSVVATVGPVTRQRLVWRHVGTPPKLQVVDRRSEGVPTGHPDEWLPDVDLNTDPWMPDLTIESPLRARVTSFSDVFHVITVWGHHLAGDASFFAMFHLDYQARYHEKVMGSEAEWAFLPSMHAVVSNTPAPEIDTSGWFGRMRELVAQDRRARQTNVGQIVGTPGDAAPIVAAATIDDDAAIQAMRGRARALGGSMTDLAVVASMQAIAEWNESRGAPVTSQRHNVAINLRGRVAEASDASLGNEGTLYEVSCPDSEWKEPESLVRAVGRDRKAFIDEGQYLHNMKVQEVIRRVLLRVPVRRRLGVIAGLAGPRSLFVTNLGIIFPEIVDGQFTGRPGLQEVGGMQITATALQGNPNPACPNLLPVMKGHLGLHLGLSGNRATCTPEELSGVLDLFKGRLLDFAA